MWLKSLRLENIKCFEDTKEIFFSRKASKYSERPYRWISLLGENGVGKSTLLQSIGLLLAGPEAAKELLPRPEGWVRNLSKPGRLSSHICQDDDDAGLYGGEQKERRNFSYSYIVTGDQPTEVSISGRKRITKEIYTEPTLIEETSMVLSWLRINAFASGNRGWFGVGYGPFRRLTREHRVLIPSLTAPTRSSNFATQFNDNEPISSFERWMVYLDFRIAKDAEDVQAQKMRAIGQKAITDLLPGDVKIQGVTKEGLILFDLHGQKVATVSLSDGYRSVIALAGDLIWRLLQTFPDLDDPTQASGVVLIDELDIHLHPVWQRQIAGWLQKTFPNLQFIVATHSPFIAIGAGAEALTLRFHTDAENGQVRIERVEDISIYDVDQALRSSAFGLISTYSPATQEKIDQYHQLSLEFPDLDEHEQKTYNELRQFMKRLQNSYQADDPSNLLDRIDKYLLEQVS